MRPTRSDTPVRGTRGTAFVYAAVLAGAASTVTLSTLGGERLLTSAPMSETAAGRMLDTADATPARLLLVPRRDLQAGQTILSNTLRLSGITVPVGVAVGAGAQVSVNGSAFSSTPTMAERGQPIVVQATAPAAGTTQTVTLTTGTLQTVWTLHSSAQIGHTHQTLYGPWGACSAAAPCDGQGTQARDILCLRSDGRFVAVSECDAGLTPTQSRSCPSPAGTSACQPRPALALGDGTQYCAAGSQVRGVCTGFTCAEPYAPQAGACVSTRQSLPVLTVSGPATLREEEGPIVLTLAADYPALVDLTLPVTIAAGSAADAADLEAGPWALHLPAGQTAASLAIALVDDDVSEPDETLILALGAPAGGATLAPGSTQISTTLIDDDTRPVLSLSAAPAAIAEAGGTATLTLTLSRDSARAITVPLMMSGDAAGEVRLSADSVTFAPRTRQATVTLQALDDAVDEADETVTVAIGAITPAEAVDPATPPPVSVTVQDDDTTPTLSLTPAQRIVAEGETERLTLALDVPSDRDISVPVSLVGAPAGVSVSPSVVVIRAGSTEAEVAIHNPEDRTDRPAISATLALSTPTPAAAVSNAANLPSAQVELTDNDPAPTVSIAVTSAPASEAASATPLQVTITRHGGTLLPVTVPFTVAIAAEGAPNIVAGTGTASPVVFAASDGDTSHVLTFTVINDALREGDGVERLTVTLGSPTHASLQGSASAVFELVDDEANYVLSATQPYSYTGGGGVLTSCAAYRNPPAGYTPATVTGHYTVNRGGTNHVFYCDMTSVPGSALTFHYVQNGLSTSNQAHNDTCKQRGLMIFTPTTRSRLDAGIAYVRSLLSTTAYPGETISGTFDHTSMGPYGLYLSSNGGTPQAWTEICTYRKLVSSHYDGLGFNAGTCPATSLAGNRFYVSPYGDWEPNGNYNAGDWLWMQGIEASTGYINDFDDHQTTGIAHSTYLCMDPADVVTTLAAEPAPTVTLTGSPIRYSDGSVARSCRDYRNPGPGRPAATTSGSYLIDADGAFDNPSGPVGGYRLGAISTNYRQAGTTTVWCDMTSDGGRGLTFAYVDSGLATNSHDDNDSCKAQGLMLYTPRNLARRDAGIAYVRDVLRKSADPRVFGPMGLYAYTNGDINAGGGGQDWGSGLCTNRPLVGPSYDSRSIAANNCPWTSIIGTTFYVTTASWSEPNGDYVAGDWLNFYTLNANWHLTGWNDAPTGPHNTYSAYACMHPIDATP